MTKGFDFRFEYDHENEEGETVTLSVEATMSESHPANYGDLSDPGWPSEGGEIEYTQVTDPYGEEWDINKPTLTQRMQHDKDECGRLIGGSGRWVDVTVPLHEAMEDAAIEAAANHYE